MTNSREMSLLILSLFTGTFCVVHGWDVQAVVSEAILGQDATFKCDLTDFAFDINNNPDGLPSGFLSIESGGTKYVTYNFYISKLDPDPSSVNSRYSYDAATQTMTIRSVECSDEKTFVCKVTTAQESKNSDAALIVKARPIAPVPMTTQPANLTGGISEGSSVSATCIANTGRNNKGRIQWRIYRDDNGVDVSDDDDANGISILVSQTSPSLSEPVCTVRSTSEIIIARVGVSDQNLVLTCFVLNDDFNDFVPSTCDSPQASLCQQSETIRIHYSVRDIRTRRLPSTVDVVEGVTVTMTCEASGFPEPRYEWTKDGDNRTLGYSSELVRENVNMEHSGNYSCLAYNVVDGTTFTNTSVVSLNVVEIPPTTTPDPAQTTVPTGNTGSPAKGDSGDDSTTVIIIVVVVVVAVVIAIIVGICIYRKRQTKEDPPRPKDIPFYNNKQNMGSPPDVLGDDKKKPPIGGSLNNSFDMKNEDGLMYADLTYDNRPRSRKPMAIGDTSSEYSDIQMPQV